MIALLVGSVSLAGCLARRADEPEHPRETERDDARLPGDRVPVARIVFVGQQEACKCARTRIDVTWKALQAALEGRPPVPVEPITMDQDEDEFDRYDEMQSLIVPPGIYFFDADGQLITLLQGEQSKQQILAVLDPGAG